MLYWLTLPIAFIAIAFMVAIVFRHWKEIRLLDPNSITEEREREKRDALVRQRFERVKAQKVIPLKQLAERIGTETRSVYRRLVAKLTELEKFYKQAKAPFAMLAPSVKERIKSLLNDAVSLGRESKWADAERRYLEVLTVDERNMDAYKGLGAIYLRQKFLPQAKETYEFIVKSKKADDIVYASLAEIAEADGNFGRAEEMRKKAVEAKPRLALRHAELAEFYLARHDAAKARVPAEKCAELDPASPRCLELWLEVAILSGDRIEAKRRYDKLRLASNDQNKLSVLKDRIENLPL